MSALQFDKPKRGRNTSNPRRCTADGCNKPAPYKMLLLGYPQGSVCGKHRNEWTAIWDGALDQPVIEPAVAA